MRIPTFLAASILPLSATPPPPLIPDTWFQEITATDGSTQQCIIFNTIPGVEYTFQHSYNLSGNWTEIGRTYGLGHQFSAAMRETAPAPPPPDPQNPPPPGPVLLPASITIKPSSGTAGGTVVSWPSLDHGNALQYLITGTMATGWGSVPLFAGIQGSHQFFISHTPGDTTPPAENPILDTKDAAMIADLEAAWSAFNTAVTTAQQTAINTPPPPPPAIDSKGFWRIKADWSLDSDGDGSPDHLEFANTATGPNGLVGNAFNGDTDGDGQPDGMQLDSDSDGVPDARDIAAQDGSATFEIGPVPRYAVFPIGNAQLQHATQKPFQINDRGTVLYTHGIWQGGVWENLITDAGNLNGARAQALNDGGIILGGGSLTITRGEEEHTISSVCYWSTPGASPAAVFAAGAEPTYASASYNFAYGLLAPGPVLSNDGRFFQPSYQWDGQGYARLRNSLWSLPDAVGGKASEIPAADDLRYFVSENLKWGASPDYKGLVQAGAALPELPFFPTNVAAAPNGRIIAMGESPGFLGQAHYAGSWHDETIYARATDIAADGTAIGMKGDGLSAPLLINGRWTELSRAVPDLPEGWTDGTAALVDTTPGGWVLATDSDPNASAALLPLRFKGLHTDTSGNVVDKATGVDDFSIGSSNPDLSPLVPEVKPVRDRIWIMAPRGETKTIRINAPLHPTSPVKISATGVVFDGMPDTVLNANGQTFTVTADENAETGAEVDAVLEMGTGTGTTTSISKPLAFKIMKKRTVNVTVYKVSQTLFDGDDRYQLELNLVPEKVSLEKFLKDFFLPQVNVEFSVVFKPVTVEAMVDAEPDGKFTVSEKDELSPDQLGVTLDSIDQAEAPALDSNITIYLLGTNMTIGKTGQAATHYPSRTCWVNARAKGIDVTLEDIAEKKLQLMNTIAHEIGHVMIGYGHPSDIPLFPTHIESRDARGYAQLVGTAHRERLMRAGNVNPKGFEHLLVKAEWDEIEKWLVNEQDEGRMD